jgi:uncharacterized protein YvpB
VAAWLSKYKKSGKIIQQAVITMKKLFSWVIGLWILSLAAMPGLGRAQALPEAAYVSGLIGYAQTYPLSCESRSAVDWAAYWGVSISESEFLLALPVTDNPDTGFVGSYYGVWGSIPPASYGVHANPVAALLRQYGLQAEARYGLSWDDLRAEIAAGRPVIVWVIGQMWPGTPVAYNTSDGHNTIVARFEHTMIFTGYDSTYVYAIDASTGAGMAFYHSTFLHSWSVLGNMAITGNGPDSPPTPTPTGPAPQRGNNPNSESYTVQRGDYLIALAERFGTTWEELARINAIYYPYTIFPGQVLTLPDQPVTITHQVYLPVLRYKAPFTTSP